MTSFRDYFILKLFKLLRMRCVLIIESIQLYPTTTTLIHCHIRRVGPEIIYRGSHTCEKDVRQCLHFFHHFHLAFSNMKETKCALSIAFMALLLMSQSFPSSAHQTITKSPNGIQSRNSVAIDSRNLGVQIKRRVRIIPTSAGTASHAKPKSSANRKDKSMFQLCSLLGVSIFFGFFLI